VAVTPHRRWRINVFAATWFSYAGYYFCRKGFGIVKAPLKDVLEVSDYQLAHIWSAYLVAYMLGQFLSSYLGRKVACRAMLLTGMAITLVCNLVFGGLALVGPDAYWPFLWFMVVNGLAQATGWPATIGMLAFWFERHERGTVLGFWATCYQLGSAMAKNFTAFTFGWLGLAWSFWGASVVMLGIWTLVWFLGRDRPEDVGLAPIVEEVTGAGTQRPAGELGWTPAVVRSIVLMGAAYFSFKFLRYGLDSWAPLVIQENFATSTETAGHISTVFDWIGFGGVVLSGWLSDRVFGGRRGTITLLMSIGMLVSVCGLWVFETSSLVVFASALALTGFFLYGPDALLSGVGVIDVGSKRGAVVAAGVVNGMGSIGPVFQEELIGYLKTYHSMTAVFLLLMCMAAVGVLGTAVLWWWSRTGRSAY
jgi:OPA family glycerol-3-phosphate transporter-like MFS transporter